VVSQVEVLSERDIVIKSLEFRDFRAFERLKLTGFRTINLIVGPSAAGKTALLEGIRLALGGTPSIALSLNAMRDMYAPQVFSREQFESIWNSYFFDFDIHRTVTLRVKNMDSQVASVQFYFDGEKVVTMQLSTSPRIPPIGIVPVAFKRKFFTGEENILYGTIAQQGNLFLEQGQEIGNATEFFLSTWQSNSMQVANWFSQLSIANQEEDVVNAIKGQFSEIVDISVQLLSQFPILHATVKSRSRKIPISLVSSGINKFLSLLIAIKNYGSGVVLIDEIENGIYYKMFPALWSALYQFSKSSGTQLFLTTHSLECLRSAVSVMGENSNDFSLIQVFQENGRSDAMVAPGDEASAAIEAGIEVRR
jgi:AAA15 family ATPase/GTPase